MVDRSQIKTKKGRRAKPKDRIQREKSTQEEGTPSGAPKPLPNIDPLMEPPKFEEQSERKDTRTNAPTPIETPRGIKALLQTRRPKLYKKGPGRPRESGMKKPDPIVNLDDYRRLYVGNFQQK